MTIINVNLDTATHLVVPRRCTKEMHNAMLETPRGIGGSPPCVSHVWDEAIKYSPPFTSLPNPDLELIEQALNMEDGTLRFGSEEFIKVQNAIAALKRIKGEV